MANVPEFVGGNLALDFHNSVSWSGGRPGPETRLTSFASLVAWLDRAGALDTQGVAALTRAARARPDQARRALHAARRLRRDLHAVFAPIAGGHEPTRAALKRLNTWFTGLRLELTAAEDGYEWAWSVDARNLDSALWPVVWAAAQLLRSEEVQHIGECAGDDCRWLFVDRSRRRNRRWCDMRECGNRAKVRRHYRRHRE